MLYNIIKWITRLTLNSYFRNIVITGYHHVPANGPVIFVSNHPSAFMDPMVVAATLGRSVHFLAAAEFFGKGFKSWFYQKFLNMIPVYRPTTLPGETYKNDEIFKRCIELLSNGVAILVFPEGNSITEKRIRKIKTGVARMAIGANELLNGRQVNVIPIGLNYSNPHRFQSDLFINIGKPIATENFAPDKSDVVRLTDKIEAGLIETVLHVQKEELDSVVKKVEVMLKRNFQSDNKSTDVQKQEEFAFQQRMIKSIQNINESQPQLITSLEQKLDGYLKKIKELEISDSSMTDLSILVSIGELTRLVFAFPLFLVGYAINSPPYYATVFYFRRLNIFEFEGSGALRGDVNPAFKGSVAMAIGMVLFIIFYLVLAFISIWFIGNVWIGAGLLVMFYFTGLAAMQYIRWFYRFQQKWRLKKFINEKRESFAILIVERLEIIKELEAMTS